MRLITLLLIFIPGTYVLLGLSQGAIGLAHESVLVSIGGVAKDCEFESGVFLEEHDEIGASEEEISQHVTLLEVGAHLDIRLKIDRRNLGHSHRHQGH